MDDRRIEKVMERRERGYIWLEKELRLSLLISAGMILTFFAVLYICDPGFRFFWQFLLAALSADGIWQYVRYRKEYRNYVHIADYLEQFEEGNYEYRTETEYMRTGIRSQITEQLERMGNAFGTLRSGLIEEKENTKTLVTDISHQLKTPVAALSMCFELMEDARITDAERAEFAARGAGEIKKLKYLTETLTNLSRMEAGMIQIHPGEASLKETLVRAVNGVYLKANMKNIEIEMEDFKDMMLPHDKKWTAEAFANVLDNAVKYSPEGTTVHIRVSPQISYVFVEIEDEGIGIAKEEYQNIFRRFYRGSRPEIEACEGAGVGLYLVRQILEEQGGSIRAVAGKAGGTVFQMTLPKKSYVQE
ncbi:sensor histidine kinase [[Clostridium] hylemonae]|nr:HAMP domain-containing sensor histidine kinase [[Clostridium] hylemonae]QEK18810.1 Alkaline phosphatase synthesis sensor protein PhoR [[Clostridium] hylemonae DSM 15053]